MNGGHNKRDRKFFLVEKMPAELVAVALSSSPANHTHGLCMKEILDILGRIM